MDFRTAISRRRSPRPRTEKKEGQVCYSVCKTRPASRALTFLKNRPLRERIMQTSLARNSHGDELDNRAMSFCARSNFARNARRFSATQVMPRISSKTRRRRRRNGEQTARRSSRRRRWRTRTRGSRRYAGDDRSGKRRISNSPRGTGLTIPKKCARRATRLMNRKSVPTSN